MRTAVARWMGFAVYVVGGWALMTQFAAGDVPAPAVAAERPGEVSDLVSRPKQTAHHSAKVVIAISSLDSPTTLSCATTADRVSTDVLVVDEVELAEVYQELGCTPAPVVPEARGRAAP